MFQEEEGNPRFSEASRQELYIPAGEDVLMFSAGPLRLRQAGQMLSGRSRDV